ncbi:putative leucine-rich repeat-containing protein DDB_G0290503 [Lucilia sericata]|uniref:putative leucine-rich repeat-containing protein DDB_G0290503 n=1 Tax=Lucilia sericata TaxID=13632 RepID=UPI0018A8258A|nr:putative leucine-rich repeat-containing protein DDB_G0290503 [Lucilia sericata]
MSFSKAKLKRFNDVDVAACGSPARHVVGTENTGTPTATATTSSSTAHPERKEQIEKFFKDAVRFASSSKDAKEFAIPKEGGLKEDKDKKSKGLRLFRTPSLPHRLRFRQNSDVTAAALSNNNNAGSSTASSTPLPSATTTPVKEMPKSASRLKGKEALHQEIRHKNELIENYISQIDVLKRHVDQLKETESKLREEHACVQLKTEGMVQELTTENKTVKDLNDQLTVENARLVEHIAQLESEIRTLQEQHSAEVSKLSDISEQLRANNEELEIASKKHLEKHELMEAQISKLDQEIKEARERLASDAEKAQQNFELIENLKNINESLIGDVDKLKKQIEQDALSYAQETKITQNEMECLKNERNTLKNDLASKCDFIKALQDELLDKNCEIDAHCDTIRQLCREKAQYVEKERLMNTAEEKVRFAEVQAEQKVQKLESDLENALEREKAYWRNELDKRQKMAENEIIKIELEKQDVMILLESTNDMLRERDEKIQKYEEQLRNGIDYYIQLTDNLQKQVVDLKQEMAKTITEKYNYQLTLNNTRSTVNILMERLKKSDADVEQLKAELESLQLAKGALEQSYLTLQAELESVKKQLAESETALQALRASSETLQKEERIDGDAATYLDMYNELKNKDESREVYMQDMKKALDEFATVLQFAQLELDNKDTTLIKVREECEQLKLENIALKSKVDDGSVKVATPAKKNSTDMEKIEGLLIDSELRSECDKIATWFLNSTEKSVRNESSNEISELLKPTTPNSKATRTCTTPVRSSGGKAVVNNVNTPRTPRTPKNSTHTPRTTPKKTVLFPGKENIPSPQKQVLKARNV